jgi:hypothetical protein
MKFETDRELLIYLYAKLDYPVDGIERVSLQQKIKEHLQSREKDIELLEQTAFMG